MKEEGLREAKQSGDTEVKGTVEFGGLEDVGWARVRTPKAAMANPIGDLPLVTHSHIAAGYPWAGQLSSAPQCHCKMIPYCLELPSLWVSP